MLTTDLFSLKGGNLAWEPGALYGVQVTWQWGPTYGAGLDLGVNVTGSGTSADPTLGKIAGGAVLNFEKIELVVNATEEENSPAYHAGVTYSWGGSPASVQLNP